MVLEGFFMGQYVGWMSGVLLLKSPKGPPTVPQKWSIYTLYVALSYALMTAIWIHFHYHHAQILEKESSTVEKFLSFSLFIGGTLFDLYFRLCFFIRAKGVVRFLKSLETHVDKLQYQDKTSWRSYKNLIMFVQVYHSIGAVVTSVWVAIVFSKHTQLLGFIPGSVYPVIFFLFGAIPLISSFFVSFAFVVCTSIHIQWIFDDFCQYFEDQVTLHEQQMMNPMMRDLGEVYSIPAGKIGTNDQILNKFQNVKLLCSQYDKICGPLLLGLLVRAVFILISSANSILLYNWGHNGDEKRLKLCLNIYSFVSEMSQLALLQLGHMIKRRIAERLEDVHRKVILMTSLGAKEQLKEVMGVVSDWKWSVSAGPGFFDIDRPLLSGVVSSLMTYVTILFQINVVTEEDSAEQSVTTTISSTLRSSNLTK